MSRRLHSPAEVQMRAPVAMTTDKSETGKLGGRGHKSSGDAPQLNRHSSTSATRIAARLKRDHQCSRPKKQVDEKPVTEIGKGFSAEQRELLRAEAESKRDQMKREREAIKAFKAQNPEASERDIVKATGIPKTTVRRRVVQKSSIDENRTTHSQRTSARQIYLPLSAEAAAQKLVQKFGVEFFDAMVRAREVLR